MNPNHVTPVNSIIIVQEIDGASTLPRLGINLIHSSNFIGRLFEMVRVE